MMKGYEMFEFLFPKLYTTETLGKVTLVNKSLLFRIVA